MYIWCRRALLPDAEGAVDGVHEFTLRGVDSDDRHWRAGYAQAVTDVMGTLNRYRKVT